MDNLKNFFSGHKIVFAILGVVLLAEVIYAAKILIFSTPPPPPARKTGIQQTAGKISLTTPKTNYKVNEIVPVSVIIDTGGRTVDGVDLVVRFDPKVLEATPGGLVKSGIFDEYPLVALDKKTGLISISGVSSLSKGYTGIGQFATLNLRAKFSGKTALTIDFNKGSTTDSNLTEVGTSRDLLEVVGNLELIVQ